MPQLGLSARRRVAAGAVFSAVAIAFVTVLLLGRDYTRFIAVLMIINAIAAMGVNIAMGFAGLVSIGHAGFGAISAYATTLMMVHWGMPYLIALPAGALLSVAVGVIIGLPALRPADAGVGRSSGLLRLHAAPSDTIARVL